MPTQPLLGQIMPVAFGARIPDGWALCDGAPLDISTNSALYTLLGTAFGGDGTKSFKLPDLRGRAAIGLGTLPLGASTGQPTVGDKHGATARPHAQPQRLDGARGWPRGGLARQ
jgi:microcystin-dependent protein